MARLLSGLALVLALAGCNTTAESPQQATAETPSTLETLEPASGETAAAPEEPAPAAETEVAALTEEAPPEAPATAVAQSTTPGVDEAAQTYLNCVVSHAAQSAEGGEAHDRAVELGVDACRNQFREARWAYRDTGVSEDAADRYGVNLLSFVRTEARNFLDTSTQ